MRKLFTEDAEKTVAATELLYFLYLFTITICHLNDWHLFCLLFKKKIFYVIHSKFIF